jgi:hypothetical protein
MRPLIGAALAALFLCLLAAGAWATSSSIVGQVFCDPVLGCGNTSGAARTLYAGGNRTLYAGGNRVLY